MNRSDEDIIRLLFTTHSDKLESFVPKRFEKYEIYGKAQVEDNLKNILQRHPNFDLYLIHPEDTELKSYKKEFTDYHGSEKVILFSGAFKDLDEWLIDRKMVCLPKSIVKTHIEQILNNFHKTGGLLRESIRAAISISAISHMKEEDPYDRHDERNRRGPRQLLILAEKKGDISIEFVKSIEHRLVNLENIENIEKVKESVAKEKFNISTTGFCGLFPRKRILLIDDEHQRGWSNVLAGILLGSNGCIISCNEQKDLEQGAGLYVIDYIGDPNIPSDLDNLWKLLEIKENNNDPMVIPFDLVLLDYRIKHEQSNTYENTSGYRILERLHEVDPSLPIIIFTASEKAKTLSELEQHDISYYYLKPIDTAGDASTDYDHFREAIQRIDKKRHVRDIWRIYTYLKKTQCIYFNSYYEEEKFLEYFKKEHSVSEEDIKEHIRCCVADVLKKAFIFTILPNKYKAHEFDLLIEAMYRVSHAIDLCIGTNSPFKDRKYNDELSKKTLLYRIAEVCRILRNIVAHGYSSSYILELDLFIQILSLLRLVFTDDFDEKYFQEIKREYSTDNDNPQIKIFIRNYGEQLHRDEKDTYEKANKISNINDIETVIKLRIKRSDKYSLWAAYLLLLDEIGSNNHSSALEKVLKALLIKRESIFSME